MTATTPFRDLPDPETQPEFYADVPTKRLLAWIVDSILIGLISALIVPFTGFIALFFLPLLWLIVSLIYRIVSLTRFSATPGMRLMALEFRARDGRRFDAGLAVVHTLAFLVSFSMVLPQVISVILMLTGSRAQGLTDLVLGSVAVNRAAAE